VPFAIALEVYLAAERVRYEIDVLDSALQLDLRAGRLPPDRRVGRSARFSHGVDTVVARGDLTYPSGRCLEVIAESNGLTALDIAPLFRGRGESGSPALDSLVQRGLVAYDHRTATFRPRVEAFLTVGESTGDLEDPLPPSSNPGLRTSVLELLSAAEARATCPLCGKALPPGPHGLLCAECTAAVGSPDVRPSSR
jgi:DNA-binding MarR family transcriptional regulator